MTQMRLTDEQESRLSRQVDEFKFRVRKGTLHFGSSMDALQCIIEGETAFPIWKTITLGTHRSAKALLKSLGREGYRLSSRAEDIMGKTTVAPTETDVDLVRVTVRDLGLGRSATLKEIYERAHERGLELCPAEVGPQLRLQYPGQSIGEWLVIAMKPIVDSDGFPNVFGVDHDDDVRWLNAYWDDAGSRRPPFDEFVFVSPQR